MQTDRMKKNCGKTTNMISSYQSYRLGQNILMRLKIYWEPKFNTLYLQWTHKYVSNILKSMWMFNSTLDHSPFPWTLNTRCMGVCAPLQPPVIHCGQNEQCWQHYQCHHAEAAQPGNGSAVTAKMTLLLVLVNFP